MAQSVWLLALEARKEPDVLPVPRVNVNRDANQLRIKGKSSASSEVAIDLSAPRELDYLTSEEILSLRKKSVSEHQDLVEGEYLPAQSVFGQIVDARPWWGLEGQFCLGNGGRSIDGESEESRWLMNPFLLLALDEGKAFRIEEPCYPVFPVAIGLTWDAARAKAVVQYDLSRFYRQKMALGFDLREISFTLENTNARDFGYNYVFLDGDRSEEIKRDQSGVLLDQVCPLKGFIHLGGSCGYPGGCNNGSPHQPELYFRVGKLPARAYFVLWKEFPSDRRQKGDFEFVMEFR